TLAFLLLLVPTSAMGAALPVLVSLVSRTDRLGHHLGRLYGWNTIGAVVGVIGAELVFIATWGISGTAVIAGIGNVLAAAGALVLSRVVSADDLPLGQAVAAPSRSRLVI